MNTNKMCLRKKRFATEVTAQAFARNFAGTCGLTPQRAYRCPHCLGWHLTTQLRDKYRSSCSIPIQMNQKRETPHEEGLDVASVKARDCVCHEREKKNIRQTCLFPLPAVSFRHDTRSHGAEARPHVTKVLFQVQVAQFLPGAHAFRASPSETALRFVSGGYRETLGRGAEYAHGIALRASRAERGWNSTGDCKMTSLEEDRSMTDRVADEMCVHGIPVHSPSACPGCHGGIRESQWQPIESAPKDGTRILVSNSYVGVYESAFENGEWPLRGWGDQAGTWYPRPQWWKPLATPAPTAALPDGSEPLR